MHTPIIDPVYNQTMIDKLTMISVLNDLDSGDNIAKIEYKVFTSNDRRFTNKWYKEYLVVSFKDGAKTIRDITGLTKGETRRIICMVIAGVDYNDPKTNAILPTEEDGWILIK